jgi:hypothetical protein
MNDQMHTGIAEATRSRAASTRRRPLSSAPSEARSPRQRRKVRATRTSR